MKIVSHRANLNGICDAENHPQQIIEALEYFSVEIDVWSIDEKWFLGHDEPTYEVNKNFFNKDMYLHCKNLQAVEELKKTDLNWFWHEGDKITLTSRGNIWCYPKVYVDGGITVMFGKPTIEEVSCLPKNIAGLCTDWPVELKKIIEEIR